MSLNYPNIVHAMGSIRGTDGAAVVAAGCTFTRSGTGTYVVSLDDEVDSAACSILVTPRGANQAYPRIAHTSDAVKTITTQSATAPSNAQDTDIDFIVFRAPR